MNNTFLRRQFQYILSQLGRAGMIGLCMLGLALFAYITVIKSAEAELKTTRSKLEAAYRPVLTSPNSAAASSLDQEEQLQIFYKSFPKQQSIPIALQGIYTAAVQLELALETGEYTWGQTGTDRLVRYRVLLPVKGTFSQLVSFVDQVLEGDNHIALENASFKRDKVSDSSVDAKLIFIVFVDAQP
jgi:Tfp pilus assembly protein PilO